MIDYLWKAAQFCAHYETRSTTGAATNPAEFTGIHAGLHLLTGIDPYAAITQNSISWYLAAAMDILPYQFKIYQLGTANIQLAIPQENALKEAWEARWLNSFPFWGKCWPAAEALATFILQHQHLLHHRFVLEMGAGLGLPSLVAATIAQHVTCTDYIAEPLAYVGIAAKANGISNITCSLLDWNRLPANIEQDVILLSDINYQPLDFQPLQQALQQFLQAGKTIFLSTPQRLMAKDFMTPLLPYIREEMEYGPIDGAWVWCGILQQQ